MNTLTQSEVFFMISSIGFIVLGGFVGVFLFYLIKAINTLIRILNLIEKDVNKIGDTTKDLIDDVRESPIFRLVLGKKRSSQKTLK